MTRKEIIGDCTLYLGDCRDILPTLGKVDAVVTDPPYGVNLGRHKGAHDTRKTALRKAGYASYDDTIENFQAIIAPALCDAISLANRSAVWISDKGAWCLPTPSAIGGAFVPSAMGRNPWGFATFQHCLFYGVAPDLHKGAKPTGFRSTEAAEVNGHPCPKPIGWMRWTLSIATRCSETVLDPFMGSGTTGVACVLDDRSFIGIELEPTYFDIACRRIEDAYKQPRLFDEPAPKPVQQSLLESSQ